MIKRFALLACAAALAAVSARADDVARVDFEEFAAGDQFGPGSPGNQMSGDVLFSDEGIGVSIGDFLSTSGSISNTPTAFVEIEADFRTNAFESQEMHFTGNIALHFDFTDLAFDVGRVDLLWAIFGGSQTLGVNGESVPLANITDAPAMLGGAAVFAAQDGILGLGDGIFGRLSLVGDIETLTIGGQELAIDNIAASIPAPSGAGAMVLGLIASTWRRRRGAN